MRSFILMAFGFAVLVGGLPSQTSLAQIASGNTRLSSAAYQPDSPVTENHLFRLQTGHYGFAYNCDSEEAKRNHPSICWRRADADQLPKRMGCLDRVRHEVAQVSRRLLDGMCDSGCDVCQPQRTKSCGCAECAAQQNVVEPGMMVALPADEAFEQTTVVESIAAEVTPATSRRSGLIGLTALEPLAEVVVPDEESFASDKQTYPEAVEYLQPPTARITSAMTGSGLDTDGSQQMGLLERLREIQSVRSSQPPTAVKPKKF